MIGVVSGAPIFVAPDASDEDIAAAKRAVEDGLNAATRRAYALAGADIAAATPVSAGGSVAPGLPLRAYRAISHALHPVAGLLLYRRSQQGKEVPERLNERMGIASIARPAKTCSGSTRQASGRRMSSCRSSRRCAANVQRSASCLRLLP